MYIYAITFGLHACNGLSIYLSISFPGLGLYIEPGRLSNTQTDQQRPEWGYYDSDCRGAWSFLSRNVELSSPAVYSACGVLEVSFFQGQNRLDCVTRPVLF